MTNTARRSKKSVADKSIQPKVPVLRAPRILLGRKLLNELKILRRLAGYEEEDTTFWSAPQSR